MQAITESGYVLNNHDAISSLDILNNYYKRIDNPLVMCEENGNSISFKITEYAVYSHLPPQYEITICFCKKGVWYNLKAYSINKEDFTKEKIKELEDSLVKMFLGI